MILITGCAGFIGFHLSMAFCSLGVKVIGIDNLNDYYNPALKNRRLELLKYKYSLTFTFEQVDLRNSSEIESVLTRYDISKVYHLAAQAGVRYSLSNPGEYITNNINGFFNLIDLCRLKNITDFVFAATSGVYGNNSVLPFSEKEPAIEPENLYSATKRANELIAYTYSKNFNMKILSLRFFTVYGEFGRPDMGIYIFADSIIKNKPIPIFNKGNHSRSFTYIHDLISIIIALHQKINSESNFQILNIGNPYQNNLFEVVKLIGKKLNSNFEYQYLELQKGDLIDTLCDFNEASKIIGNFEFTSLEKGISNFIEWFRAEGYKYANS
jgi:UDP-glucuronate 4-epimerase